MGKDEKTELGHISIQCHGVGYGDTECERDMYVRGSSAGGSGGGPAV